MKRRAIRRVGENVHKDYRRGPLGSLHPDDIGAIRTLYDRTGADIPYLGLPVDVVGFPSKKRMSRARQTMEAVARWPH